MKDKLIKITSTKNNGQTYCRTFPAGLRGRAVKYYIGQRKYYAAGELSGGVIAGLYPKDRDNNPPLSFTMYNGRTFT